MEKVMSVEERIRRAEDIYNRRNGGYVRSIRNEKENKVKKGNVKKLLMQILVCLFIYVIFYAVSNREHIFSEEFRNEVNIFLTETTNLSGFFENIKSYVKSKFSTSDTKDENSESENSIEENVTNKEQNDTEKSDKIEENIGGAEETKKQKKTQTEETKNENLSEQQIMEKDAKEIKEKISFIVPINRKNKFNTWVEKSNYSKCSKISYWIGYCCKRRNSYKISYRWRSYFSIIKGGLWKSLSDKNR